MRESIAEEDKIPAWEITPEILGDIRVRMKLDPVYLNMTKGGKNHEGLPESHGEDPNVWKECFENPGMIAWQVLLATSSFGCILFSLYRFAFRNYHALTRVHRLGQVLKARRRCSLAAFGISMILSSNLSSYQWIL